MKAFEQDTLTCVLSPHADGATSHVAGSIVIDADCGHRAWIAPSGRAALAAHQGPTRTICLTCVAAGHGPDQKFLPFGSVPGQVEEARDAGMSDAEMRLLDATIREMSRRARTRHN